MRNYYQIHTLGAPHYKRTFDFWENERILSASYGPKNTVVEASISANMYAPLFF